MALSKFENEILAMGLYLERAYDYNIYGELRDVVSLHLQKEGVSVNDLPLSKNIDLNIRSKKHRDQYIAQALGLATRIAS
jgi:hypothetical protein